jgi:hypothetical protein
MKSTRYEAVNSGFFFHPPEISSLLGPNVHLSTEQSNTFNSIHELALLFLRFFPSTVLEVFEILIHTRCSGMSFACGLYMDVFNSTYCIAPYDRVVVNTELERMWKKPDVA